MITYMTFEVAYFKGDALGFVVVVACDMQACLADCAEAGFDVCHVSQV